MIETLLPSFGNLAFTIAAFVIALMVIVAIHELGHYLVGRWCGIKAEVFSLGFGPVLASRRDRRGTRWQIAALPFGGYVRFLGDGNAASVGGDGGGHDPRQTMQGAPLWARAATVIAGPLFNFILAVALFAGMAMVQGRLPERITVDEIAALPPGFAHELRAGDEILGMNGADAGSAEAFYGAIEGLPEQRVIDYRVRRGGDEMVVSGPYPRPAFVQGVTPRSAAQEAGLARGDVITGANGAEIITFGQLQQIVLAAEGSPVDLTVWREGETRSLTLTPRRTDTPGADGGFETRWLIGVTGGIVFSPRTEAVGLGAALGAGWDRLITVLHLSLSGIWHMLTGAISTCNLSSPVGIAETSGAMAAQGTTSYIAFIAFLSVAVGLFNLMPIPVLDGGHLLFYLYEAVTGAPPSERILNGALAFGLALLMTVMAMALLNDLWLCP